MDKKGLVWKELIPMILILICFLAIIVLIPGELWQKGRKMMDNALPSADEVKKIWREVKAPESKDVEEDRIEAERIKEFIKQNTKEIKAKDCIKDFDFNKIKTDFYIGFSKERGEQFWIYKKSKEVMQNIFPGDFNRVFCYLDEERNIIYDFEINLDSKEVKFGEKEEELGNLLYVNDENEICFVSKTLTYPLNNDKLSCDLREEISALESIPYNDENYVSKRLELIRLYLKEKKYNLILDEYIFLKKFRTDLNKEEIEKLERYKSLAIDSLKEIIGNKNEWYLCNSNRVCYYNKDVFNAFCKERETIIHPYSLEECEEERFKIITLELSERFK